MTEQMPTESFVTNSRNGHAEPESAFASLNGVLLQWFYKLDLQAIRIVLGTIKSHYLRLGDPCWLFVVAPPGTGKTTVSIMGASRLSEIIMLSDLTENTLLSGFYGHEKPGLLEKLGSTRKEGNASITEGTGLLLVKDFTSVLLMRREKRAAILGQLREIHDGEWKRDFGTGETKIWRGRLTIVAAVTPVLDRHYSIFTVLGERFLQVRWHRPDSPQAGEMAIDQQQNEEQIRAECQSAVAEIFRRSNATAPSLPREAKWRIAALAEVVAIGRTHVFRNSYGQREIDYAPEPEANTRISKQLASLARGIAALNRRDPVAEPDLQDAFRVGLDCLPDNRRKLLLAALADQDLNCVPMPRTVRRRELEELEALGLIEPVGVIVEDCDWRLSEHVRRLLHFARVAT
jgi:hypothetical protein